MLGSSNRRRKLYLHAAAKLKVDIFQFTKLCRAQASVTVTPGTEFGKQYGDFIRMNFSQDHDKAVDAVKRICKMVDIYRA